MPSARPPSSLEILDELECLRLLGREPVGRLGLTASALPVVVPVNFVLDDRTLVFGSDPGSKLDSARARDVACLEIDGYDRWTHTGWSVLATGRLGEVTDPERIAQVERLPLRPWAVAAACHFVELPIELLSGRRIAVPRQPERNTDVEHR